jgi:uncharacterized protein (DUF3820 family)
MVAYTDKTLMPYGKYKGTALANIPADYFLYLYHEKMISNFLLLKYVENNLDVLESQVKNKKFNAR